jgi:peroxiredoxin
MNVMTRFPRTAILSFAALLSVAASAVCAPPAPGTKAPAFRAPAVNRAPRTLGLSDLRGRIVVLDFWGVGCPPCRIEMPHLQALYQRYKSRGVVVFGVTQPGASTAEVRAAMKQMGITYPVVLDKEARIEMRYRLAAHPTTLVLDRGGRVRYSHTGYARGDERAIEAAVTKLLPSKTTPSQ